ncbi:MAG: monofunctional biosynthetic peptidoglycan transglycosylase [Deltaproteobacteria bacterium]|nr:monofunctional biosynthetic peptidoglycan transglycosylase [Deltaproteobacteria bacterium]
MSSPKAPTARKVPLWRSGLRWARRIAEGFVVVMALGALLLWCSVPNTARLEERNPASTAFIDLRRAQAEDEGRPWQLKWTWRPIGQISRYLRAAVIYAEDYNFYRHDGVDWGAIEDAIDANRARGALAIGGSTITQQLAKNLYLSPARSFIRKARELLIAFSLEDHLSKQRILELYLNVVEWGDGVFGAEAAAQHWFRHSAQSLSPAEAVRLAIALPNPFKRAPNIHTPELTKKAVRIIRCLRLQGLIDADQERVALDTVGARGEKVLPSRPAPGAPLPIPPDVPAEAMEKLEKDERNEKNEKNATAPEAPAAGDAADVPIDAASEVEAAPAPAEGSADPAPAP